MYAFIFYIPIYYYTVAGENSMIVQFRDWNNQYENFWVNCKKIEENTKYSEFYAE